jgi:hypothetical protein
VRSSRSPFPAARRPILALMAVVASAGVWGCGGSDDSSADRAATVAAVPDLAPPSSPRARAVARAVENAYDALAEQDTVAFCEGMTPSAQATLGQLTSCPSAIAELIATAERKGVRDRLGDAEVVGVDLHENGEHAAANAEFGGDVVRVTLRELDGEWLLNAEPPLPSR